MGARRRTTYLRAPSSPAPLAWENTIPTPSPTRITLVLRTEIYSQSDHPALIPLLRPESLSSLDGWKHDGQRLPSSMLSRFRPITLCLYRHWWLYCPISESKAQTERTFAGIYLYRPLPIPSRSVVYLRLTVSVRAEDPGHHGPARVHSDFTAAGP